MAAPKMTKNQMRRAKKKEERKMKADGKADGKAETEVKAVEETPVENKADTTPTDITPTDTTPTDTDPKTTDKPASLPPPAPDPEFDYDDPSFAQFKDVFDKFGPNLLDDAVGREANAGNQGEVFMDDQFEAIPDDDNETNDASQTLSKKKRKKLNTLSIAELKALVRTPEVVDWHDVSSSDPRLLVIIKAQKNIVPVPGHWSLKREYLSSKRGVEKPPFRLPPFIADTGIAEMRDAVLEKQAEQTLKQKQRERVQPKMGKLDIDYQKLYDAFFRFQTKPSLTRFGDVYYEGKEWETEYRNFKPGAPLSDALREALNLPVGFPPPWLLQQQRVGPPPSYPNLVIPGLNAPLPAGASWGFAPGQWGKPPVDDYNRPLYGGDVFGLTGSGGGADGMLHGQAAAAAAAQAALGVPIERAIWGELQPPQDDEEEEEEEDDDDEDEEEEEEQEDDRDIPGGLETPSGYVSTVPTDYPAGPLGVDASSMAGDFDLRKQRRGFDTEASVTTGGGGGGGGGPSRSAYTVIPERQAQAHGFFGSDRTYDLSKTAGTVLGSGDDDGSRNKRKKPGDVDVALDPDELLQKDGAALSKAELQRRFDEGRRDEGVGAQWRRSSEYDEDLSAMIAQESRKRQKVAEERKADKKEQKYRF